MVASPEEIQNFDDHPEEFIHLALDTCDKQLSENYKTAASQLLEIICDNIDGAISLVGDICIRNLKASILKISNPNISDDQILPLIQDQIQSIFVKQNSSESRIETSFLALSVMSYTIPKRVDIVTEIENFFRQNLPVLLNFNTMSGLVISRICMFIGYYSDTIFQSKQESDEQIYLQLIDYLFKCTQLTGKQGIALQAIDALINIYDEEELSARLKTTIKPMFSLLINSIETTTVTQYLDLVQTMILTFQVELQENLPLVLQCLQCLVERIKKEFQLVQSGERTTQLYINKCWNIIRVIADTEGYIVKICNEMEELLLPLLSAIQQPEKIEFDDDILLTITSFLKFKQTITPLTAQLLQYFPQVLKKQNNLFAHMFQTLSYVINYGKQYFEQNTNETIAILQMIIQMSVESMCAVGKRITEADQGEGAILLQMIILEFSHILSDEMWNVIFTKVTERLNQPVENYFLKGRLLGIYLQGFFKQPEKTRVMLQDVLGIINNVFDLILEKCENYSTNFDIKVFVLGTCSILLQQSFTEHIQQKFPTILDFNITLLKKQEVMEVKKRKGHSMEENSDDDGEYDSDDDEDYKFGEDSIIQDKITLDYLVCNIKKADEFDHFKQCMFALKDRNQEQLYQILNLLNQEKGSFLKHLLNMQRINVGEKQVVRKIVKRKKNE
uniref:Armadillo-type fold protein n=1 Tax=Philasterides dicentrarchi TaxID=282688 RepID=A0A5J6DUX2_9CILI|nr:armadillo-type fold protein [Philasterides dicentrarchi]